MPTSNRMTTVFQLGYVTNDLDYACKVFSDQVGLKKIAVFEGFAIPSKGEDMVIDVGLAYAGETQIELIKPVSGPIEHYLSAVSAEQAEPIVRLHHFCYDLPSPEAFEQVRQGYLDAKVPTLDLYPNGTGLLLYADTFDLLGHWSEYVYADEATREFMATLPRN